VITITSLYILASTQRNMPPSNKTLIVQAALTATLLITSSAGFAQEIFTNNLGMKFVKIPAGSFMMGSCDKPSKTGAQLQQDKQMEFLGQSSVPAPIAQCPPGITNSIPDEKPRHRVNLRSFWMGATEVTVGQFKQFLIAKNRTDIMTRLFISQNEWPEQGDQYPVTHVTWLNAQYFIKWLNEKEGGGYRLPSEAEWEYACRAGGNHKYCGIDKAGPGFRPVGTGGPPNNWGLYDMSGSAREWVQDTRQPNYEGAPNDGSAWEKPTKSNSKVLRGGSSISYELHATGRESMPPDTMPEYVGFRVARNP